ncbi:hemin uptake protein HemP [Pontivivens insulae]|uniref:Hemin uptake protein HemP n=1 Tax=Pontivivens insulae TaxID=1639689 RepID=A0A2R8A8W3_9RHOB|nr:hemin uptake protein HemP [Pontivivens insulae]RED18765.1 hemin uptake protein HemP [Pontivivens insulae]SPF28663.1 hypothetical protein POI8812_00966 [Pontivivens insulae]
MCETVSTSSPASQAAPAHDARELIGPDGDAVIRLDDKSYVLRITRQNKLILTK